MATTSQLQTYLAEAEAALHKLQIGTKAVSVSYDGRSVTYNQADMSSLREYIASLKKQLGTGDGRSAGVRVDF